MSTSGPSCSSTFSSEETNPAMPASTLASPALDTSSNHMSASRSGSSVEHMNSYNMSPTQLTQGVGQMQGHKKSASVPTVRMAPLSSNRVVGNCILPELVDGSTRGFSSPFTYPNISSKVLPPSVSDAVSDRENVSGTKRVSINQAVSGSSIPRRRSSLKFSAAYLTSDNGPKGLQTLTSLGQKHVVAGDKHSGTSPSLEGDRVRAVAGAGKALMHKLTAFPLPHTHKTNTQDHQNNSITGTMDQNGKASNVEGISSGSGKLSSLFGLTTNPARKKSMIARRNSISYLPVAYENIEMPMDLEEIATAALAQRYSHERYKGAALLIQSYYRRYRMRIRFMEMRGTFVHGSSDINHAGALSNQSAADMSDEESLISPEDATYGSLMRKGVCLFNRDPKKGIMFLRKERLILSSHEATAAFLLRADELRLSKTKIGEYLGGSSTVIVQTLREFVNLLQFSDTHFYDALASFLSHFRMSGEAQVVDRIMEAFARRYYQQNPTQGGFEIWDTAYILAYSCIMLHTDAHNQNVARKMTREEFIRNNRGINNGKSINPEYLSDLYARITTKEWKTTDVYVDEMTSKIQSIRESSNKRAYIGLNRIVQPWRYFVMELDVGLIKDYFSRIYGTHSRKLVLFNDMLLITKRKKQADVFRTLVPLFGMIRITASSSQFYKNAFEVHNLDQHFKLGPFLAKDQAKGEAFLAALDQYILESESMENERMAHLNGNSNVQQHSNQKNTNTHISLSMGFSTPPARTQNYKAPSDAVTFSTQYLYGSGKGGSDKGRERDKNKDRETPPFRLEKQYSQTVYNMSMREGSKEESGTESGELHTIYTAFSSDNMQDATPTQTPPLRLSQSHSESPRGHKNTLNSNRAEIIAPTVAKQKHSNTSSSTISGTVRRKILSQSPDPGTEFHFNPRSPITQDDETHGNKITLSINEKNALPLGLSRKDSQLATKQPKARAPTSSMFRRNKTGGSRERPQSCYASPSPGHIGRADVKDASDEGHTALGFGGDGTGNTDADNTTDDATTGDDMTDSSMDCVMRRRSANLMQSQSLDVLGDLRNTTSETKKKKRHGSGACGLRGSRSTDAMRKTKEGARKKRNLSPWIGHEGAGVCTDELQGAGTGPDEVDSGALGPKSARMSASKRFADDALTAVPLSSLTSESTPNIYLLGPGSANDHCRQTTRQDDDAKLAGAGGKLGRGFPSDACMKLQSEERDALEEAARGEGRAVQTQHAHAPCIEKRAVSAGIFKFFDLDLFKGKRKSSKSNGGGDGGSTKGSAEGSNAGSGAEDRPAGSPAKKSREHKPASNLRSRWGLENKRGATMAGEGNGNKSGTHAVKMDHPLVRRRMSSASTGSAKGSRTETGAVKDVSRICGELGALSSRSDDLVYKRSSSSTPAQVEP
ncbi:hypothetical protein SARC_06167 [Sphaeroforma arctica JP610]|uniref:SEC7 domain-containing protein n=1 Tax=Sphaeroforma arctica JP610 TaxID=667725 RepID=A0A0L0FY79_9EUKA|nr:hypothetical protein SARC_06167 [Sphaeroforma arctica JP610]KNC81521.1 hypothetical protein SARC_06167 [Sphaeroforma arctica JP610]|eukprot:XP_014155423.1 hypothetical protein SARC_06167 [Sphaeroforma arctica JP610]